MYLGILAVLVLAATECSAQGLRPLRIRGQSQGYNSTASVSNSTTAKTTSTHTKSPVLTSTTSDRTSLQSTSLISSTKKTNAQPQASSSPAGYIPSSSSVIGTGAHPYSSSSPLTSHGSSSSSSVPSTNLETGSSLPNSSSTSSYVSSPSSILGTGLSKPSSKVTGTGLSIVHSSTNSTHGPSSSVVLATGGNSSSHSISHSTQTYSYAPSGGSSRTSTNSSTPVGYTTRSYSYAPSGGGSIATGNSTGPNGHIGTGTIPHKPTSSPVNGTSSSHTNATSSSSANATSSSSANATCSGATLNVLDAYFDWWYTRTLYNVVSIFKPQFNGNDTETGWTLIPAQTSFDLTSAIATPECSSSLTYNSQYNTSLYGFSCTNAPTPVAADTTVITQTAFVSPAANTGTGSIPSVVITPPPATATIANDGSYSQGQDIVWFTAYEIVSKNPTTFANGSIGCEAVGTSTYTMATPFSFEYSGSATGSQEVGASATGDVNPALLGVVGQSNAKAGSWVAAATVVMVVQDVFEAEGVLAAFKHGTLTTEPSLLTPSPTLPSGVTKGTTNTGKGFTKPATKGTVQEQQSSLDVPPPAKTGKKTTNGGGPQKTTMKPGQQSPTTGGGQSPTKSPGGNPKSPTGAPGQQTPGSKPSTTVAPFVATHKGKTVTLEVGVRPKQTIVTAKYSGQTVTATRITTKGGGVGGIISAIKSVIQPTNAPEVLSQAELTYKNGHHAAENPTVSAILHGIHTNKPGSGPGSVHTTPVIVVGGKTITANSATQFSIGKSATLTPGGTAVVSGTTYSLLPGASGVVVNGHTSTLSQATITAAPAGPPIVTVGGHTYTPNPGTTYVINGQTLTPGGVVTVHGTTISLAPGASSIVVNGATENIAATKPNSNPALITSPPVLTIGGETFTPINNGPTYSINGETLTPGEQETVTVHGTTYVVSLAPGASSLQIETEGPGGQVTATTLETLKPGSAAITAPPVLTIGGEIFTPINNGPTYNINGETLTPGEEETVTIHGTTYIVSLAPGASVLEIETEGPNGQVTATSFETLAPGPVTAPPLLTIGSETFTPINNGPTYNINGETLTPGEKETVTIDGKTYVISLAHGATVLVIETEGPGGAITATTFETLTPGIGPRPTVTATDVVPATAGAGSRSSSGVVQQTSGPGPAGLQNGAVSIQKFETSAIVIAVGTLALAILL